MPEQLAKLEKLNASVSVQTQSLKNPTRSELRQTLCGSSSSLSRYPSSNVQFGELLGSAIFCPVSTKKSR
jgi:hypothetical protein